MLILQFWNVDILMHFNFALSHLPSALLTGNEFSRVFYFEMLS